MGHGVRRTVAGLSLTVVAFLWIGTSPPLLAQSPSPPVETAPLTLDRAADLALEHDLTARIAELALQEAQVRYEKDMAENLLTESSYNRRSAEGNLQAARIAYEDQRAQIIIDAVRGYFSVLAGELDTEIKASQLKVAELQLEAVQRQVQAGNAGRLDELEAQAQVDDARLVLQAAQNQAQQDLDTLRSTLGLEADAKLDLEKDIPVSDAGYDLEPAIDRALQRSATVYDAETALDLARLDLERARAEGAARLDLEAAQLAVRKAELELEQARRTVRQDVIHSYHALMQAADRLRIQETRLSAEQKRHDVIQQQFEAGLKTEVERLNAKIALAQAQANRLSALQQYYEALLGFRKMIGAPLGLGTKDSTSGTSHAAQ